MIDDVLRRLVHGPALVVNPGIDDKPDGTTQLRMKSADVTRITWRICPHLLGQCFCIKRPALLIATVTEVFAKFGITLAFACQCDLQIMAGNRLVIGKRFQSP